MESFIPALLGQQATSENARQIVERLRELMADPELPAELRAQLQGELLRLQNRFPERFSNSSE